ncbi:arginine--tRNA ligase [Candidatus Kaiserbacteria bacterium RIFCSPHIGHO2_01_FULL_56_24]|uniref:Arginine--tRNA ligase n=1 Tax=Candidatus Kaiserbacteria bacterium RIFCSPHIGHO2_01_FULL_56_24 TaxID=1798487 RepID=A0A1F6DC54_9BACT|nr:MAG: arginine--tRNA ligase [Candidatus Kaiserbacteria bacterium RIFCSPHIGHO2_01_FULL_56_24]
MQQIRDALATALEKEGISGVSIPLEHTADFAHGDYSSSVALAFSKPLGTNPRALAEKLVVSLAEVEGVSKIEIAGPGFINFTLSSEFLFQTLAEGRRHGSKWGSGTLLQGEQILVEYTSPNLFKPLHIGNLIGNIVGESITRLFEFSGADVKRINYPSDIGLPVAKCVWGLQKTGGDPKDIHALGESYRVGNEGYENDPATKELIDAINKALYEDSDKDLTALRKAGIKTSRKHLAELCKRLGTKFDLEFFESETGPIGRDIVLRNVDGVFEKSDGAIVYKGEKVGLHTRVFVNSAGLPTYEAKDLGNFELKEKEYPKWDRSYIVVGVEQKEYLKVVFAAIKEVFPEAKDRVLEHIANGFLTLTTGKMSSRMGNVITGESLIDDLITVAKEHAVDSRAEDKEKLAQEVAVAAIKFQILKGGTGKDIIFDRERALSVEGDSGPYLQYTHARTQAIMEKAGDAGIKPKFDANVPADELVRLLFRFYETVKRAQEELEPHHVANYLIAVAGAFNSWYAKEQILDGTPAAAHKVALTDITRITLKNGLWLLGIPAPEKV